MTGTSGGVGPGSPPGRRWDVALSFAGAQRDYVGQVAAALKARGVRCFYDADELVRLWGTHLAEELPRIYARESAAVVVFVSADYAGRNWTRLERRAAFSQAVIEAGVYVLPARFDDSELPGLLPDVVAVDLRRYTAGQFADLVVAKLAELSISPSPPLDGADWGPPPGGVRVSEADPRRLGVHAAISVPGVPDEILPEYVRRDADAAEHGVRVGVAAAERRGGLVLLVGGSSVGKTRCAFEAVRALLPDWWLVHPDGAAKVAALAQAPAPRTVVWLDELQRYLDGEHGLTGGVVRALLGAPHPAVIIGTLWPDRYAAYTAVPAPGGADPHAREREVLELAAVVRIGPAFSEAEQGRAKAAAARDTRLQVALEAAGYGLTQTLAAAPQLVARWEDAETVDPYAWAVLTAALDAVRLGARAELTAEFLRAAAPGYCTDVQQAEAPENWFEQALAYVTTKLNGAVAALSPAGPGMGQIAGYTVADYLIQHASRERRYACVPASTWDAVLSHIRDPDHAARLADSARDRLLYRYAIPLYRHAANAGDRAAAERLAGLEELRARAGIGEGPAVMRLVDLLAWGIYALWAYPWEPEKLRARADAGDRRAAWHLADLLADLGDLEELRARANAGDRPAAGMLAYRLTRDGDMEGAVQTILARADVGDRAAAERLAGLLAGRGDLTATDDAERVLVELLADYEELDGLRARADAGDDDTADLLAWLLASRWDLEELRARADARAGHAADLLAWLLAGQLDGLADHGDLEELCARADTGDRHAAQQLADLMADRKDLDALLTGGDVSDRADVQRLAELLAGRGDLEELRTRADDEHVAELWAWLLDRLLAAVADCGDPEELRARAAADDTRAAWQLADLLARHGDLDELRARADTGDGFAAQRLAWLLADRGDLEELRARADTGDGFAAQPLARLLADRGDLAGLRALAGRGDQDPELLPGLLANLLIKQDRGDEAERLRRFGLNPDGSTAQA